METKTLLLPVRLFVSCARRRETKNFISSSRSYARQILKLLSLGSVLCEQRDVTFEVTDASFCAATCQAYEEVWWWLWNRVIMTSFLEDVMWPLDQSFVSLFSTTESEPLDVCWAESLDWSDALDRNAASLPCGSDGWYCCLYIWGKNESFKLSFHFQSTLHTLSELRARTQEYRICSEVPSISSHFLVCLRFRFCIDL
jgi:hypothetical protein